MSFIGTCMPGLEYITQRGPMQHGETVIDYRLNARLIQYVIRLNSCSRQGFWESRWNLLDLIRPNRQYAGQLSPGILRKRIPGGYIRDIDVFIQQGPEFAPRSIEEWDEFGITEALRFYAPDPTFYDPTLQCLTWSVISFNELVFPLTFIKEGIGDGLIFGMGIINAIESITYLGTWMTFPTIEIDGPMSGPTIENLATGEKITLNYQILDGETVTIALPFGNKTVTNNLGANLAGTVSTDSDLAAFHIAPHPEAPGGVNQIHVIGTDAILGTTQIRLSFYTRYIGI